MQKTAVPVLERPGRKRQDVLIALSLWTPRHILIALVATVGVAVLIGLSSVLIPNPIFGRDIPPVWWNYPVWILTSVFSGMLIATYVAPDSSDAGEDAPAPGTDPDPDPGPDPGAQRSGRMGLAGGVLTWFAVGCPVCNKIALLALGYSGALTWFAPVQPYLALVGLVLTGVALNWRLRGQVSCPVPTPTGDPR